MRRAEGQVDEAQAGTQDHGAQGQSDREEDRPELRQAERRQLQCGDQDGEERQGVGEHAASDASGKI